MRVLVTGSTGLVGRAIASRLGEQHSVVGLSRSEADDLPAEHHLRVDLGSEGAAASILEGVGRCDVIVHAAAALSSRFFDEDMVATNCAGTMAALRVATEWKAQQFLYLSGVAVVGRPVDLPVEETHRAEPRTSYHATKLFGEHLVRAAAEDGLRAGAFRLSAPVGPGMPAGRIMPVFVARAARGETIEVAGKGTRRQDYVDVRDVAEAVAAAVGTEVEGCFNVARGAAISNLELAHLCVELLGSTSEVTVGDRPDPEEGERWEISIEKARQAFGYRPQRALPEMIEGLAGRLG